MEKTEGKERTKEKESPMEKVKAHGTQEKEVATASKWNVHQS